jgi:alkylation response protein AidB-like acyl-CoA dehydrogenase
VDFSFSQEQLLLRESVGKYVDKHGGVERHRQLCGTQLGFDPDAWQQFAELGWLGLPFGEEQGGYGGSTTDLMVLAEALGKGLVREPLLSTVITCGGFLRRGASAQQQQRYIPSIIDGSAQWAFAFAEQGSGYDLARVSTTATIAAADEAGTYRLNGAKTTVLNGHAADYLVVSVRSAGEDAGISLFIVDAGLPGISREHFVAIDGSCGAHIRLDNVLVGAQDLLSGPDRAPGLMAAVINDAIVAMGGEALGAMQQLLDATVEYTRTRQQFGQPISKFQALQHRMAEMYLKVEETRSLLYDAAIQLDEGSAQGPRACAGLKVKLAEAGRFVSQQAVQLHGGIGMTDELNVGHYYKRLMMLASLYGDEAYYLQRYVDLGKAGPA